LLVGYFIPFTKFLTPYMKVIDGAITAYDASGPLMKLGATVHYWNTLVDVNVCEMNGKVTECPTVVGLTSASSPQFTLGGYYSFVGTSSDPSQCAKSTQGPGVPANDFGISLISLKSGLPVKANVDATNPGDLTTDYGISNVGGGFSVWHGGSAGCPFWITPGVPWIKINGQSGPLYDNALYAGFYSVSADPNTSGTQRTGTVDFAGVTYTITQPIP
jgi:hypothetical protein